MSEFHTGQTRVTGNARPSKNGMRLEGHEVSLEAAHAALKTVRIASVGWLPPDLSLAKVVQAMAGGDEPFITSREYRSTPARWIVLHQSHTTVWNAQMPDAISEAAGVVFHTKSVPAPELGGRVEILDAIYTSPTGTMFTTTSRGMSPDEVVRILTNLGPATL